MCLFLDYQKNIYIRRRFPKTHPQLFHRLFHTVFHTVFHATFLSFQQPYFFSFPHNFPAELGGTSPQGPPGAARGRQEQPGAARGRMDGGDDGTDGRRRRGERDGTDRQTTHEDGTDGRTDRRRRRRRYGHDMTCFEFLNITLGPVFIRSH